MPLNALSYNTMFIDEAALKSQSLINDNVDMKMLTPIIKLCQEKYLTKILGTGLYVYLQNCIVNQQNPGTIPPDQYGPSWGYVMQPQDLELLNIYVQPLLVWLIMQDAPTYITYKLMNKGLSTQSSDTSKPAPLGEVQSFQNLARNNADWYTQRLMDYLIAFMQEYPAYLQYKTWNDVIPDTRGYKTSVYLGNGWGNNRARTWWGGFFGDCDGCDPWVFYR
jgi:hypothetical protein